MGRYHMALRSQDAKAYKNSTAKAVMTSAVLP